MNIKEYQVAVSVMRKARKALKELGVEMYFDGGAACVKNIPKSSFKTLLKTYTIEEKDLQHSGAVFYFYNRDELLMTIQEILEDQWIKIEGMYQWQEQARKKINKENRNVFYSEWTYIY